jgi:DNA (cytosine-5)-methyltransferase 1
MLNGLDIFSGIGGISIALRDWVRPIAYCEIDPYCQSILFNRMAEGGLCIAPIWEDIRLLNIESGKFPNHLVDIIYGGFPCQDISIAGHGKGLAGERSGLFWEIHRLAKEILPKFIFLENVPTITSRGGLTVIRAFAEMGYDCRWCTISAASIGALHRRERWFLLAYSNNSGCQEQRKCFSNEKRHASTKCGGFWEVEPNVGRVADGIPCRMDRVRTLGNAVVPEQAKEAFKILMGIR